MRCLIYINMFSICLLAFLIEATALLLSFMTFINAEEACFFAKIILIHLSFTATILCAFLGFTEIILCAFLGLFLAHLWAAVNMELTFSTQAEHRAMMLMKEQSNWVDRSGRGRNIPISGVIPDKRSIFASGLEVCSE